MYTIRRMDKQLINPMHDPEVIAKRKAKRDLVWKNNAKHNAFMKAWLEPSSETYGNAYQSALNVGFSKSYALNMTGQAPKWISEYIQKLDFTTEHIKQGLQGLAVSAKDSRSPDDTRLKAYEILAKVTGMIDSGKGNTTVNIVQPILNGESVKPRAVKSEVIEQVDAEDGVG